MENYFRNKENAEKRLDDYVQRLSKLSIEDLEKFISNVYHKNENTKRNGCKVYNPIPNIEEVIIKFIEDIGKDVTLEYNKHFNREGNDYDVQASLIKTNERYWVSSYIMGKTWFEPFEFGDLNLNVCKCNKCNKGLLFSEAYIFYDYSNTDAIQKIYFYCEEHYKKIKELL